MALTVAAEAPYAFRQRLVTVHRHDRRDWSEKAKPGEFEFADGAQIAVEDGAPELAWRAAEDFREYLLVSMGVNASVRKASSGARPGLKDAVSVRIAAAGRQGYTVSTGADGVKVVASDARMAAQALYHLEDLMNLRRAPFVAFGEERRAPVFAHRLTFSGYGNDIFPDGHLSQIAHHGFTCIEVWLDGYDVISQGARQDVNDLIGRAARYGLDVKLSPRNKAFVHPDDPKAEAMYEEAYGKLAKYYSRAAGIGFCGEVCEFPSKDPRSNGWRHDMKRPEALSSRGF